MYPIHLPQIIKVSYNLFHSAYFCFPSSKGMLWWLHLCCPLTLLSSLCLWGNRSTKCGSNCDLHKVLAASWVTTLRISVQVSAEYPFLRNTGASLPCPSSKDGTVTVDSDPVTQLHQSVSWLWFFRALSKFSVQQKIKQLL